MTEKKTDEPDTLRSEVMHLLDYMSEHFTDEGVAAILQLALMTHLITCADPRITITTANYLDSAFADMRSQFTSMGTEETVSVH